MHAQQGCDGRCAVEVGWRRALGEVVDGLLAHSEWVVA